MEHALTLQFRVQSSRGSRLGRPRLLSRRFFVFSTFRRRRGDVQKHNARTFLRGMGEHAQQLLTVASGQRRVATPLTPCVPHLPRTLPQRAPVNPPGLDECDDMFIRLTLAHPATGRAGCTSAELWMQRRQPNRKQVTFPRELYLLRSLQLQKRVRASSRCYWLNRPKASCSVIAVADRQA